MIKVIRDGVDITHLSIAPENNIGIKDDWGAMPHEYWPLWAKSLALLAKPEDKGVGDVTRRLIGDERSEKFKAWFKMTFKRDCGCAGRQAQWNRLYRLDNPKAK